jgi:hypothetical protein
MFRLHRFYILRIQSMHYTAPLTLKGQSHEKVCEIMIWDVSFGLNYSKVRPHSFKIARLKSTGTGFQREELSKYKRFSDFVDFAINRWTVHRTAIAC